MYYTDLNITKQGICCCTVKSSDHGFVFYKKLKIIILDFCVGILVILIVLSQCSFMLGMPEK